MVTIIRAFATKEQREHGGTRPGHHGRDTLGSQPPDQRVCLRHRRRPVVLVQPVLRRVKQDAGRTALLVAALTQLPAAMSPGAGSPGEAGALFDATRDWLHQDYRSAAMPETDALVRRLRDEGIPAVVSGAGPSVLALLWGHEDTDYRHHLDILGSIVRETGIAWQISSLDVERHGARVLPPEPLPGS